MKYRYDGWDLNDGETSFFDAISSVAKDRILANKEYGEDVWGALSNLSWTHKKHGTLGYSFRTIGAIIATIIGKGDYLDWYCSGDTATVPEWFRDGMKERGWKPEVPGPGDIIRYKVTREK